MTDIIRDRLLSLAETQERIEAAREIERIKSTVAILQVHFDAAPKDEDLDAVEERLMAYVKDVAESIKEDNIAGRKQLLLEIQSMHAASTDASQKAIKAQHDKWITKGLAGAAVLIALLLGGVETALKVAQSPGFLNPF